MQLRRNNTRVLLMIRISYTYYTTRTLNVPIHTICIQYLVLRGFMRRKLIVMGDCSTRKIYKINSQFIINNMNEAFLSENSILKKLHIQSCMMQKVWTPKITSSACVFQGDHVLTLTNCFCVITTKPNTPSSW